MDIFEAEMARRFVVAVEKIANALDRKDEPQTETKTETQNSNLTFEKRTMRDCYNCKRYETEGECVECHYEPKDEPQTMYYPQVDGITPSVIVKDEPQTERSSK